MGADQADSGKLLPEVEASLAALDLDPRDQAAAALARSYARRIDQAAAASSAADRVLRAVKAAEEETELVEQVSALKAKLAEQAVLKELGARLEAVLASLHATSASRVKLPPGRPAANSRLTQFRSGA
ncbi:hypothetical protein GCM10010472_10750 [Pseudonocardia halophobica]|uniref:Uncharacterized protein n=1 Tax=Pseudonocardia halophobica TaxID=29401 RepID=A0A9W6L5I8_9PSEU|nr:hypothetical protein [Pseudonocardia halophobica]GLL13462.1 hypothetical protein GCM10017577_46060 [Pseudonocardia halophobica]